MSDLTPPTPTETEIAALRKENDELRNDIDSDRSLFGWLLALSAVITILALFIMALYVNSHDNANRRQIESLSAQVGYIGPCPPIDQFGVYYFCNDSIANRIAKTDQLARDAKAAADNAQATASSKSTASTQPRVVPTRPERPTETLPPPTTAPSTTVPGDYLNGCMTYPNGTKMCRFWRNDKMGTRQYKPGDSITWNSVTVGPNNDMPVCVSNRDSGTRYSAVIDHTEEDARNNDWVIYLGKYDSAGNYTILGAYYAGKLGIFPPGEVDLRPATTVIYGSCSGIG